MRFAIIPAVLLCAMLSACGSGNDIPPLSEEEYIEIAAGLNVLDEMHRVVQRDIRNSGDAEFGTESIERQRKVSTWATDQFMRETDELLAEHGVTIESVREFEQKNPYFLDKPENIERINARINELIRESGN